MNSTQYIAFAGGGSGGHVFPGLAVWETLQARNFSNCLWIGSCTGPEKSVLSRYGIPFYAIQTGKFRRYASFKNITDMFRIIKGIVQSRILLKKHNVTYVVSTGGFASFPVVFAAWTLKIPVASIILDISLSLANKLNKLFSSVLFFSYASTIEKTKSKSPKIYSAYPVRSQIYAADPTFVKHLYPKLFLEKSVKKKQETASTKNKQQMITHYQQSKKLLFCVGGSLGAEQINEMVPHLLTRLSHDVIIFHQTGKQTVEKSSIDTEKKESTDIEEINKKRVHYIQKEFFSEDFAHILAASDVVLCRAGTGMLWECAILSRPTVLIPLSRSISRGDQIENATYFSKKGAMLNLYKDVNDSVELEEVIQTVQTLLDDVSKQQELSQACKTLFPKNKSVDIIADYIASLLYYK